MPTILNPWARVREEQQVDTLRFLLQFWAEHRNWNIYSQEVTGEFGYSDFISRHLKLYDSPLYIVEQDMVPTTKQLSELSECFENACVIPYRLREGQWSLWEIHGIVWNFLEPPFPEFVQYSGLGLVKLSRGTINRLRAFWTPMPWSMIDYELSEMMQSLNIQWHVHAGEVVHNRTAGDLRA